MKVILLTTILSLHTWICVCDTGQTAENKQQHKGDTADLKANEELIWKKMRSSLLYIQASDRAMFLMRCGGGYTCTQNDISSNKWLAGTGEVAKNRFWHTYSCFKAKDIKACPVDGVWGAWSSWSKCTAKCGEEGNSTRIRQCDNPLQINGGLACPGYSTTSSICRGNCNENVGQLAAFSKSTAFLTIIHKDNPRLGSLCLNSHCLYRQVASVLHGGDAERYWSSLQCFKYKRACPVDGGWSSWTSWSDCEPKCGAGIHWRIRNCTNPSPANNGFICRGPFYEEKPCTGMRCSKTDFVFGDYLSEWTVFGPCSVSCGQYGVKEKRRVCLAQNRCVDLQKRKYHELVVRKPCFRGPCTPTDGTWSSWSPYTECSAICGKGRQIRIRTCNGLHSSGRTVCTGQSINVTSCEKKCEKNNTLINGTVKATAQSFVPVHTTQPKAWRTDFNNPYLYELEPDRIGIFTQWSQWSSCSKSCEIGQRSRYRNCTVAGQCDGEVRQALFCNTEECPVNGGWSEWSSWTYCSTTCGKGKKKRYRKCDKPLPQFGGTCFGNKEETRICNPAKCKGLQLDYAHWTAWSPCSKTCGVGGRIRSRNCRLSWKYTQDRRYWSMLQKRVPICMTRGNNRFSGTCAQMPCPVFGDWAHWGSWSKCSHSCGKGIHFRDRTCSDPAPLYGGSNCKGQGSEVSPCFHGPCPDRKDIGARLNGSSGLLYAPFHKPQSYLSLHLVLNPLRPNGIVVYRSRTCNLEKCRHSVKVSLVDGKPLVEVVSRSSRITIMSNTTLQVREWHTVYVYLSQHHGFLRVNNGAHLRAEYHPKPSVPINYDSGMTLGTDANKGFVGVIAEVKVNYQVLSLQRMAGWSGYGMPEKEWLTQTVRVDPVTKYPKFKGDTYLRLSIKDLQTLHVQMSIWPQKLEGLVLFNKGRIPGSFMYLMIHMGVFRYCFNCGQQSLCENIQDVEAMRWYHVSIDLTGISSSIRINLGKAVQLTSPGLPYHPGSHVFVGGGEKHDWVIFTAITGIDRGFSGSFHEVTINGQFYGLRNLPLVDNRGFMNTEGVSSTEKMLEVVERSDSKVVLKCDFSRYVHSGKDVYVEWFHVDKKIKSGPTQKIVPRLPGDSYLGSLTLSAKHHGSGLYVCIVQYGGQLANHIAFVLTRDDTDRAYDAVIKEMTGAQDFLIFMAFFVLFSLVCFTFKMFQLTKEDGVRPILQKLKELKARATGKDKAKTMVPQPPGVDELDEAELVPKEKTDETDGDSSVDVKDTQDISDSSKPGDFEIILQTSSNSEDDGDEGNEEVIQSHQSIHNHPSIHGTSAAALHQHSMMSQGVRESSLTLQDTQSARDYIQDVEIPRRSSVTLRGTQSTRDDINGEEILRRSSVTLRGTQSTRDDINGEEIPRRSSVTLRGTPSTRDDINNDEIPRRSSITLRGTQGTRDDINGEEIPRRSSVTLRGTLSARDDINDDENPRRSSVYLRDTQSAKEGLTGCDSPRRSSITVHGTQRSRDDINDDQVLSDEHPPPPPISWTHRSTQEISKDHFRSGISINQYYQSSSTLEKQLSNTLPPAGSPSPPKSPQFWTSPSRQQPDLAITVSANKSLTGSLDQQSSLPKLPSAPTLPQNPCQNLMTTENAMTKHNEETCEMHSSSDNTTDSDTGTDSETSASFPPLPKPPSV